MEPSQLETLIRRRLKDRGWTQHALAERSGLPFETVRSILEGRRRRPELETIHRLASGLEVDARDLEAASLEDRGFTRHQIMKALASAPSALLQADGRPGLELQAGKSAPPGSEADLNDLAVVVRDLRAQDRKRVRADCHQVIQAYRDKVRLSDDAARVVAQCHALEGVADHEQEDAPPERGRKLLSLAQQEAQSIGDLSVQIYALCNEAEQHRKEADATGNPGAEGYATARSLFEAAFEKLVGHPELAGLHVLCIAEAAKVPYGQRKETDFWDYVQQGTVLVRQLAEGAPSGATSGDLWPPLIEEYAQTCFWDAQLRGFALFGGVRVDVMKATARQARQLASGLAIVQDKATLNLALGEGLLRSPRKEDLLEGIECLGEAVRFSKATGYRRQLASARRVLRRVKVPSTLSPVACSWCGPDTMFELDQGIGYRCSRCQRVVIWLT